MIKNLYVDIHVLQTVPPSCVNRDDTGSPKTAVYGGSTRARVSSQAWKHAIRQYFETIFPAEQLGKRTKHIVELVKEAVCKENPELTSEKAEKMAIKAFENAGLKIKDATKGTDALFFISEGQIQALAQLTIDGETDKKKYKEALQENPSIDMAMFGRMAASDPSLNYDATYSCGRLFQRRQCWGRSFGHCRIQLCNAISFCNSERERTGEIRRH